MRYAYLQIITNEAEIPLLDKTNLFQVYSNMVKKNKQDRQWW